MQDEKKEQSYDEVIEELSVRWNIKELLSFSEINIQEKLSTNASQIWHFTELFHREKNEYDKIMEMKEQLTGQLYNHYKTNIQLDLKYSEIEKFYIPKDPKMMKMNQIARRQKWVVDFYDGLRKALEKMQWNMKEFMDGMIKAGL